MMSMRGVALTVLLGFCWWPTGGEVWHPCWSGPEQ